MPANAAAQATGFKIDLMVPTQDYSGEEEVIVSPAAIETRVGLFIGDAIVTWKEASLTDERAPALVVFDLSGTTIQDRGQVPAAFAAAFERAGLRLKAEDLRAVRGTTKRQAILNLVCAQDRVERAEHVYQAFREDLRARYAADGVQPIAGTLDTFAWLRHHQIRIALTTGFDRDITTMLLTSLGWTNAVADAIVCGEDVAHGRPAPDLILRAMALTMTEDVRRVAVVGDTVHDLQAGARAGVRWNIGVLSGAHDRAALAAAPHTHLLGSVANLPELWPSVVGQSSV
jgi:phosphonatase-like hydrolase